MARFTHQRQIWPHGLSTSVLRPKVPVSVRARLGRVIRAIAEAEIADELAQTSVEGVPFLEETAAVLEARMFGMPKHFAVGMILLTLTFDHSTRATDGAPFARLSLAQRRKALARVRALPLGPLKNFTMFFDKMVPFIFWSHLEEHGQIQVILQEDAQ